MAADSGPKVEVVLKNVCKQLGEGPHWDDATQTLLFVDIEERQVHRWNPATKTHDVKQLGNDDDNDNNDYSNDTADADHDEYDSNSNDNIKIK